jgi:ribose transport system ATP-binding protein
MMRGEAMTAQEPSPTLQVTGISKSFGGVPALSDASLTIRAGEIHGLLGQNGSGKSTLIKILAGYHAPDPGGSLVVEGEPTHLPLAPGQSRELGIAFVHQDLGLEDRLTVLENLRVGRYAHRALGRISWRAERQRARTTLDRFDLDINVDQLVSRLSESERAMLALVRAVQDVSETERRGLLVLDEPTVYLPRDAVDRLFQVMNRIAAEGIAILFVSHQLEEVLMVTHRVTVLRDGRVVGTAKTSDTDDETLVAMILGRHLRGLYPEHAPQLPGRSLVAVKNLGGTLSRDVSFEVGRGETLGVTGLVGMGWDEIPYLVYGARQATSGEITFGGNSVPAAEMSPERSLRSGVALVPANRLRDGIVSSLSIEDNVGLPVLGRHFSGMRLRLGALRQAVSEVLRRVDVRPAEPRRRLGTLSGGNQQRAVLGKWLQIEPAVLLLHEPTQGVDVGARKQIFGLIRDATKAGRGVLIATADNEDLGHLCDRVLIFRDGRVVCELSGNAVTPERILDESYRPATAMAG